MKRTTSVALVAVLAVAALVFFLTERVGTKARQFDGEPQVNLVVGKESGETRTMPMEAYIQGVVAGEMGQLPAEGGEKSDWPQEAYAAQAILARSFALTFLTNEGDVQISTDVAEAQAYAPENITPAIKRAVEETRGKVMLNQDDFVKAWFHSYSGGRTATAKEGLNYQNDEPDFVRAREMPANEYVPETHKSWTVAIPLADVTKSLAERGIDVGQVTAVRINDKGPSGRATELEVTGTGGTKQVHAADFRVAVDPGKMKSTLLEKMEVEGGELVMSGSGFGHGVGLSQWDAYNLAKDGQSAEEIMNFFFKNITVQQLWD